ncbi:LuxR C-terminal-related transcriptional regulator [Metasolibacillus meyeri]|uniref:LuxR C-terminal-related transcriptional regulator n=1 Tax=Metasolibacillus meyeri TaxID=1071052 RepID=A0AAW9NUB1_9BACL|nr:LuxR C-terminal-related transcriptional regulator [Metasolibacillus meyeri]MEC1178413.1 LuxR C-terminal-related transcriptional regulator [Metasolibacillus meyeri]
MFLQQIHPLKDSYHFRKRILELIKRKIPYEAYCFTTVDPQTLLSTGALTDERIELLHPQLFENEYNGEDLNRYTELLEKKIYCQTIFEATKGDMSRSKRFQEILAPNGFIDELRAVLVYKNHCYGFLTLYRIEEQGVFCQAEIDALNQSLASIAQRLKESISHSFQTRKSVDETITETGIIILDQTLNVISTNQMGLKFLVWLRQEEQIESNRLPRPIRAICSQDKGADASKMVLYAFNHLFMTLTVSQLFTPSTPIALLIERISPNEAKKILLSLYHLTSREYELVELLLEGKSTKCIANELSISAYTVQDHLKSIFLKVDVNSRRELVGKIADICR